MADAGRPAHTIWILTALLSVAVMFALGCGTTEQDAATETPDTEATEMAEPVLSAFEQMRNEFAGTAEATLAEWGQKITDLEAKKNSLSEVAQKPLEEPMKMLLEKRDALTTQVQGLATADEATLAGSSSSDARR